MAKKKERNIFNCKINVSASDDYRATLPEPRGVTCSLWHWHVSLPRLTQCDSVEIIISGPHYRALTPLPRPARSGGPRQAGGGRRGSGNEPAVWRKEGRGRWNRRMNLRKWERQLGSGETRPVQSTSFWKEVERGRVGGWGWGGGGVSPWFYAISGGCVHAGPADKPGGWINHVKNPPPSSAREQVMENEGREGVPPPPPRHNIITKRRAKRGQPNWIKLF